MRSLGIFAAIALCLGMALEADAACRQRGRILHRERTVVRSVTRSNVAVQAAPKACATCAPQKK